MHVHHTPTTQPESPLMCVNVSDAADVEKLKNTHKTNVDMRKRAIAANHIKRDSN